MPLGHKDRQALLVPQVRKDRRGPLEPQALRVLKDQRDRKDQQDRNSL
jgi:hypothetical protein